MFKKILIANRGEIALRIHRACKELGIAAVAIHSTADEDAMHVRLADEAVCVGPAEASRSYLNVPAIISACDITGAEAVHPGYGFLSENARFAEIVTEHGLAFIGPSAAHIRMMGDKVAARSRMEALDVPCVPGSRSAVRSGIQAEAEAKRIGFPLLVKASAGGGGRGMKRVDGPDALSAALASARAEAQASFGDGTVYLERFLSCPRHIEIQIMADAHGNVVHLGERDCSLQRRHQKLLEEAPSPAIDEAMRAKIGTIAATAAREMGYVGAGTMEFLHEDGAFFFIEMNTRIQVEHPVTEAVYNVDLVREQIQIAFGERLSFTQASLVPNGHAIECRINAEDPHTFRPSPGRVTGYHPAGGPGVRVDSALFQGASVPPWYDGLVAKLIVHDANRGLCLARLKGALSEMVIDGVTTNAPLFNDLLKEPAFRTGDYHIGWLEEWLGERMRK